MGPEGSQGGGDEHPTTQSQREEVHHPTQRDGDAHKGSKNFGAVDHAFARRVFGHHAENHGGQRGKQKHGWKMCNNHSEERIKYEL